jgi:Ca2+-binding EF-hand superfamily protein
MRRLLAVALVAACAAGAAAAPAPTAKAPPKLFLSPCGEPFRQGPDDPDPLKAWFDQADTDHDGSIDRAEFRADAVRFFKKLDENGDGVIDGFEAADYESKIAPELGEWAEGRFPGEFGAGPHRRPGRSGAAKRGATRGAARGIAQLIDEPEPVTGADFNLDSRITLAEWIRAADQRFDILDSAKTGRLTLDALRARLAAPPK